MLIRKLSVMLCMASLVATVSAQTPVNHKKPAYQTEAEKMLRNPKKNEALFKAASYKAFPSNIVLPGEFEESQAVAISWSFDYDNNGNPTGLDLTSVYADVSAQLANAIQQECPVWIRVLKNSDTTLVLNNMVTRGTPLHNYKFIVANGDDWWTRDYGPMAFYSKNLDSIGFTDMKYYDGRDNDNLFPQQLADAMGYQNYVTTLNAEGGNLMGDGYGKLFFSDVITNINADNTIHSAPWTQQQTFDTLTAVFGTKELVKLKTLNCDGGTGHIDLYVKLIDEQTLIVAQYPQEITAQDKQIIEDNVQILAALKSTYNRPFRILRVEHPTNDNGQHTRKTCAQIDADARNFINGLTVNGSFIFPSYYDGSTGNAAQHQRIMEYYKRYMPGYKIVPIDSRNISPLGGAIHCITMQIPVENPLRIWHPSIDGIVPQQTSYHLVAKGENQSGIKEAYAYWRKNNDANWTKLTLTDSSGYWVGDILNPGLTGDDSLSYYIEMTSNNGKTAYKPMLKSNGAYYIMKLRYLTGTSNLVENTDHLFTVWPNPANQSAVIQFKLAHSGNAEIEVMDISGKRVFAKSFENTGDGVNTCEIQTENLPAGMYVYRLLVDSKPVMSKKLIINH